MSKLGTGDKIPKSNRTWKCTIKAGSTADTRIYIYQHPRDGVARESSSGFEHYNREFLTLEEMMVYVATLLIEENWPSAIYVYPDVGQWGKGK